MVLSMLEESEEKVGDMFAEIVMTIMEMEMVLKRKLENFVSDYLKNHSLQSEIMQVQCGIIYRITNKTNLNWDLNCFRLRFSIIYSILKYLTLNLLFQIK